MIEEICWQSIMKNVTVVLCMHPDLLCLLRRVLMLQGWGIIRKQFPSLPLKPCRLYTQDSLVWSYVPHCSLKFILLIIIEQNRYYVPIPEQYFILALVEKKCRILSSQKEINVNHSFSLFLMRWLGCLWVVSREYHWRGSENMTVLNTLYSHRISFPLLIKNILLLEISDISSEGIYG